MYGVWTQHGQILCEQCAETIAKGMQIKMRDQVGLVYCDHCHGIVHADESLAREQHLMYEARQKGYINTYMVQTGGMCHACEITFEDYSGRTWCMSCTMQINPSDPGEYYWWTEIYADTCELASEREASSEEEIFSNISWMQRNCSTIPSAGPTAKW